MHPILFNEDISLLRFFFFNFFKIDCYAMHNFLFIYLFFSSSWNRQVVFKVYSGANFHTLQQTCMGAMQTLLCTWKGAMQTSLCTWSGYIVSGMTTLLNCYFFQKKKYIYIYVYTFLWFTISVFIWIFPKYSSEIQMFWLLNLKY